MEPNGIRAHLDKVSPVPGSTSEGAGPLSGEAALARLVHNLVSRPTDSSRAKAAPPKLAPVQEGERVGPYRLASRIRVVGTSSLWLAEPADPRHPPVQLLVMEPGKHAETALQAFESKRLSLSVLSHPNIASVIDGGRDDHGRTYFAMVQVRGEPLLSYADAHRLTIRQRVELLRQICEGVHFAHRGGVMHGAISASKIVVRDDDGRRTAKVVGFGFPGDVLRSERWERYVAPELLSPQSNGGESPIDAGADVYSLGVVLYELLTGLLPFDTPAAAPTTNGSRSHQQAPVLPSTRLARLGVAGIEPAYKRHLESEELVDCFHGQLDDILVKATQRRREDRYATTAELADDLGHYLAGRPLRGQAFGISRIPRLTRRNAGPILIVAGVVLTAVLALSALFRNFDLSRLGLSGEATPRSDADKRALDAERKKLVDAVAQSMAATRAAEAERKRLDQAAAQSEAERRKLAEALEKAETDARTAEAERKKLADSIAKSEAEARNSEQERKDLAIATAKAKEEARAAAEERQRLADAVAKSQAEAAAAEAERKRLAAEVAIAMEKGQAAEDERQRLLEQTSRAEAQARAAEDERQKAAEAFARADTTAKAAEAERQRLADAVTKAQENSRAVEAERQALAEQASRLAASEQTTEADRRRLAEAIARSEANAKAVELERLRLADAVAKATEQAQAAEAERQRLASAASKPEAPDATSKPETVSSEPDQNSHAAAPMKPAPDAPPDKPVAAVTPAPAQETQPKPIDPPVGPLPAAHQSAAPQVPAASATDRPREAALKALESAIDGAAPGSDLQGAVANAVGEIERQESKDKSRESQLLAGVAALLEGRSRFAEALMPLDRAIRAKQAAAGEDAVDVLAMVDHAAALAERANQPDVAEAYLRESVDRHQRAVGASDAKTIASMESLGTFLIRRSKPAAAEAVLRDVVSRRRTAFGAENAATLQAQRLHGEALTKLGRYRDAGSVLGGGEAAARRVLADSDELVTYLMALGAARVGQSSFEQAEKALRDAYTLASERGGDLARRCAGHLEALYDAWDRAQPGRGYAGMAEEWRGRR